VPQDSKHILEGSFVESPYAAKQVGNDVSGVNSEIERVNPVTKRRILSA
jgi:hypothetical protein